jgi:hypothetical protein
MRKTKNLWELIQAECEVAQRAAEEKLGRPLTQQERLKIWTTGEPLRASLLALEIRAAKTAAQVEQYLADLPVPDKVLEG